MSCQNVALAFKPLYDRAAIRSRYEGTPFIRTYQHIPTRPSVQARLLLWPVNWSVAQEQYKNQKKKRRNSVEMKNWKRKVKQRKQSLWGAGGVCHLTTSHNYITKTNNIKRNYTPGRRTEGQPWVSEGEGQDKALRRHKTKGPLAQRQKTEDRRHQLPLNPTASLVYHFSWRAARIHKHTHRGTFILDVSCRLTVALFSATWKCNCSRLITSQLIYSLPQSKLSRKDVW